MSLVERLATELNVTVEDIPQVSTLPNQVQNFVHAVELNFSGTADKLRTRAMQLRDAAADLEDRANKLDEASPRITREIEEWIAFERACAIRQQSLSLVKT